MAQSRRSLSPASSPAMSTSVKSTGGCAGPGRARQVGRLRVQLDPPGRLVVPQPQPGRGPQERAGQVVLGEPVQLPAGGLGLAQRLAELSREVAQHADLGLARWGVPAWFGTFYAERSVRPRPAQRFRVLGGHRLGGRVLRLADDLLDLFGADPGPGDDACRRSVGPPVDGDDGELTGAGHAVGGEGVSRPAQVGAGGLLGDHHAVVGSAGRQGALDGFLRVAHCSPPARLRLAHWPSSTVLRIRIPRSSAAGQPWLTGATWPGWPLPQLNAPPST